MKTQTNRAIVLFVVCSTMASFIALTAGCGPSGPKTYQVSGKVTCDGKPIKQGSIVFRPLDKDLSPEGGSIKDGLFEAKAKAGKNRVEIMALDIGPNTQYVGGNPIATNFIPARYNEQSELEEDINSGNREFEFDVQSK